MKCKPNTTKLAAFVGLISHKNGKSFLYSLLKCCKKFKNENYWLEKYMCFLTYRNSIRRLYYQFGCKYNYIQTLNSFFFFSICLHFRFACSIFLCNLIKFFANFQFKHNSVHCGICSTYAMQCLLWLTCFT